MLKPLLVIFVLLCVVTGCSKQSAPDVSDIEVRGKAEQERLDACSNVNFNKGVLLYQNVILLFKCTNWSKDFPHLFNSMNKISADSWNQVFTPINDSFIEDQARRDRFFKKVRDLDAMGGLDNLSYVIVALNETNFFDSTKEMFKCVENPTLDFCQNRKNIPTKKSLKNIIHIMNIDPNAIGELSVFLSHLNKAIAPEQEKLRAEVNKFRRVSAFIPLRLRLVDSLAQKIKSGLTDEDRTFLYKILTIGNANSNNPWIYDWLHDENLGREKFKNLVEYPVIRNNTFIADVNGIRDLYNKGLNCRIKSTDAINDYLDIDLKKGIADYLDVVKLGGYKRFYEYSSTHITGLKASAEICKDLDDNAYNVSLISAATKVADFFSEKKNYDLIKFILKNSTSGGDKDKSFAENIYLGDLFVQPTFSAFNSLNGFIFSNTREFYPAIYDIAIKLPPSALLNIATVVEEISKSENDLAFKGIADFWNFFSDEEKNFVFNFVDRHFDEGVNYSLLFDFYSKFLEDIQETQPVFKNAWTGTELKDEQSYLALEDFFYNLSGKENLQDLKKFFSRDQILKVLEVLSNGQKLVNQAKSDLQYRDSTDYIHRVKSDKFKYTMKYNQDNEPNYDSKALVACMQKYTELQNGFYYLIKHLPEECTKISNENISMRLFGWLNSIQSDYAIYNKPLNVKEGIFDQNGILSPMMLNANIGLMKIADSIVGKYQSVMPTTDGVAYTLNSLNYYLNDKNGIKVLDNQVSLVNSYFEVLPDKNQFYRNSLLKSFSTPSNFSYGKNVITNISNLISDYGSWINSGSYAKAKNRSLGTFDPANTCEKTLNQFIAPNACPSKEVVKKWGNDLLFYLQNTWEPEMGSPLKHLMTGTMMNGGINIPLNGSSTTKFRITLRDNMKYLYDTFDRSYPVNNQNMYYENSNGDGKSVNVTTLERVETVIREVRFGNNYLGVSYLNHVVEGDDYNSDVKERRRLVQSCVKIPKVRCGRSMSASDLRMAKNAVEAFDSLLDVNNGRGLDSRLKYGQFLKGFQQTLVASSAKEAQALTVLPLDDSVLKQHNGVVLGDITMLSGFSNGARFIKDRIGRTRADFEKFLAREDFKRVDRVMLNGFDLNKAVPAAERVVAKIKKIPTGERQNLFENSVDWLAGLSYEESLLVEDTLARMAVVGSFLGTPDLVFNQATQSKDFDRYKNNNMYLMFLGLEKIVDVWPSLKNYFPADAKLIDVVKPINTFLYFLTEKLNSTNDPYKNTVYLALNDTFLVLQTVLFEDVFDNKIIGNQNQSIRGIDLVSEGIKNSALVVNTYEAIRSAYRFSENFFESNGLTFLTLGQNLKRLALDSRIDMTSIREYLSFTTKNAVCVVGDSTCEVNYHYDEFANLTKYLSHKNTVGISNLEIANKKIFQENYTQILGTISDVLPILKIKAVVIPYY